MHTRMLLAALLLLATVAPTASAYSVHVQPDPEIYMTWLEIRTTDRECPPAEPCDSTITVLDGRESLEVMEPTVRFTESVAFNWSCKHTGQLRWVSALWVADGAVVTRRGHLWVPRCSKPRPRPVSRARAAAVAANQSQEYVLRSICRSANGRTQSARWRCQVNHANSYRACDSTYRLAFTREKYFGKRIDDKRVRRISHRCYY